MKLPEWFKPALYGAGAGAVVLAIGGFNLGGWMTADSADELSKKNSVAAVAQVLTPYCLEKSKMDPNAAEVLVKFKEAKDYSRRGIVEDAGWATPLGADGPNHALAQACVEELTKNI